MKFNRSVLAAGLAMDTPIKELANRAVGKTTAAVFAAIAKSYAQPGEWVRVEDPDDDTFGKRAHTMDAVAHVLRANSLRRIEVDVRRYAVHVNLDFVHPRDIQYVQASVREGVYIRNTFAESV